MRLSQSQAQLSLRTTAHEGKTTLVYNKTDLLEQRGTSRTDGISISALHGTGITELIDHIKQLAGFESDGESLFTARRRHITALQSASDAVQRGLKQLQLHNAGELLADELLQAQNALNEIYR